jgi:lysophospholipase L1-like esterase
MIEIFSFGASTAAGSKDDTGGGFIGRLVTRLKSNNLGHSTNYGIGGQTTNDMVVRLSKLNNIPPNNIAIISLGINDVSRTPDTNPNKRVPLSQHETNVSEILTHFNTRCKTIYTSQYPVQYAQKGLNPDEVEAYINTSLTLAKKQNIHTIDIFSMIDNTRFETFIHSDGMHFNSKGHKFIADQIWQFFETNQLLN